MALRRLLGMARFSGAAVSAAGFAVLALWLSAFANADPPPREANAAPAPAAARMSPRGLYILHCSGCHGPNGAGAASARVPAFQDSISALARDPEGRVYITHVPGVSGAGLRDFELADVLNYVVLRWGDADITVEPFTEAEIATLRRLQIADIVAYRRAIAARLSRDGVAIADYPWP